MLYYLVKKMRCKRLKAQLIGSRHIVIEGNSFECRAPANCFLDDYVYVGKDCKFYGIGELYIHSNVIIGNDTTILTSNHQYEGDMLPYDEGITPKNQVVIEQNVWIASYCLILPGVTVHEGAVVGAGSVVTKDVPPLSIVGGNPAKIIRYRDKEKYNRLVSEQKFYLKVKFGDDVVK